jgi:signal transduction histidine kinase
MELADRADEMARGDLSKPVPVTEPDEIGVLAAAFEHLRTSLRGKIEDIEALNAGLEDEVRNRTAELSQALEALKASQAALVQSEKLASLGQLVAGVAHEINNPVNALINVLDPLEELGAAIEDSEAAEDFHDMVRVLRNGAERTRGIVSDLKTFSRLDEAELKSADIREGLRATLHLVKGGLPGGVSVSLALPDDLPDLLCYPGPLNQVFLNLVTNAVQAVGESGTVQVSARLDKDQVVVEVQDDGPGMADDVAAKVFDPFFTTKEVGSGTGLGLSISHGIVSRHGGHIDVSTSPGAGALFSVHLPLNATS